MLTNEQIEANKIEFIELINSINRSGMYKDQLINMLTDSDFFTAPASTKYHCSFDGGLCLHSLNVYKNLKELVQNREGLTPSCYDEDSLKIVALFHDISKIGCYKKGIKNEKVYFEGGTKKDELGNFEWVSKPMWVTREDKFIYGSHEATSEYMTRQYIPLTLEESLEFLGDDELLEVTPENLRIRKKTLDHTIRGRETFRKKQELNNK